MKYVYDHDIAHDFLTYLMARYQDGSKKYIFSSEDGIEVGTLVSITANNGISCNAIVGSAVWDEGNELWKYTCYKVIATPATASVQTVTQLTSVTTPVIQFSASTQQITIPYANGSPDFSNAYIDLTVLRDGIDVTNDWTFNYTASGVTGAFHPTIHNKFVVTGISSTSASISFQASREVVFFYGLHAGLFLAPCVCDEFLRVMRHSQDFGIQRNPERQHRPASVYRRLSWRYSLRGVAE